MRDELSDIFGSFTPEHSHEDPVRRAQIQMKRPLPKRFYTAVTVEADDNGYAVKLDGRGVKTPGKNPLVLPTRPAAELVAAEWRAQVEVIDPERMPATRLANTAIDAVADQAEAVFEDIVRYSGSDMLCYRADGPERLVERQRERWDPVLGWMAETHGARFILVEGVIHQEQPSEATAAFARALEPNLSPLSLACLHVVTTLTGSATLTLALKDRYLSVDEVWALAHLDEDWTDEHWGVDPEAEARRAKRFVEISAAAAMLEALRAAS
ncbi:MULTISPECIES: ATP12 family chaperone protein [Alphaproteobacteria]|uniref:ATPase n=2 Tax=Alphaproteobacteria TaxID=28211 RepID=A0A512HHS8_9HYPH|nr:MULTISPECIES: ATP12 family chaperone protein [Alphaproteobacteria]GEO84993.1 ATPase [Ciceribacter naphthalenivorans]GLR22927.1 ATPase [Ciceribacter naphthalenivorans]GLT05783.1 ATPase [Sphingomonas psychrolutea]